MASQYPHGHAFDLFVSYSTRDLDWVRVFHDDLVADINRFADLDVFPFLDKARLQPGYIWNEQLLAAASDSAIFVPVLSPRFFLSDYCQKELRAFIETNGLASGSAYRSRILPVKLLCSAPRDNPLAQVQAASFCTERDDDIPFEHQPGTLEYKEALRKLAYAMAQSRAFPFPGPTPSTSDPKRRSLPAVRPLSLAITARDLESRPEQYYRAFGKCNEFKAYGFLGSHTPQKNRRRGTHPSHSCSGPLWHNGKVFTESGARSLQFLVNALGSGHAPGHA